MWRRAKSSLVSKAQLLLKLWVADRESEARGYSPVTPEEIDLLRYVIETTIHRPSLIPSLGGTWLPLKGLTSSPLVSTLF